MGSLGSSGSPVAHSSGTASPTHSFHETPSLGAHLGDRSSPQSSPVLGAGFTSLSSAANPQLARPRPASGESSPLGLYGAIGSKAAPGSGGSVGSPGLGSPIASNPWDNNNGNYGQ